MEVRADLVRRTKRRESKAKLRGWSFCQKSVWCFEQPQTAQVKLYLLLESEGIYWTTKTLRNRLLTSRTPSASSSKTSLSWMSLFKTYSIKRLLEWTLRFTYRSSEKVAYWMRMEKTTKMIRYFKMSSKNHLTLRVESTDYSRNLRTTRTMTISISFQN